MAIQGASLVLTGLFRNDLTDHKLTRHILRSAYTFHHRSMLGAVVIGAIILILCVLLFYHNKIAALLTLVVEAIFAVVALALIGYRPGFNLVEVILSIAIVILITWDLAASPS